MEKNIRRSPCQIDIKAVLQGKFILRRREKKDQEGHQKNCISTKGTGTVSLDFGVVCCGVFFAEAPSGLILFLFGRRSI